MPRAISMAKRQDIMNAYQKGASINRLSKTFKVNRNTIAQLIQRAKINGGENLSPRYANCGKNRPNEKAFIFRAVRCFRAWHPTWGAEKIHAEIRRLRPTLKLPHYRSFYRWFHWNKQLKKMPLSRPPKVLTVSAQALHEGWQIDAKEELELADTSRNCWLNIVDEYSGTVIDPPVFSPQ